jgi:hypothetical protein
VLPSEEIARIKEIRDNGIEAMIEKILVAREHAALTPEEREQVTKDWQQVEMSP